MPHIGWNDVSWQRTHPYVRRDPRRHAVLLRAFVRAGRERGHRGQSPSTDGRFAAVASRDNVFATQFHPEKSGEAGLAIYANFVKAVSG